jgi:hypothetical protein
LSKGWSSTVALLFLPGPALRPFTAIGLCRSVSQNYSSQPISCKTSETVQEDKATASGSPTQTDSLTVCGSALGRGAVAITPETTLKHPHLPTERRPKAVISFPARVVKEPLPLLVGSSTRLFSKKLMKACSSVAPRPPQDFHKACSQSLSKPVVNTHTNCWEGIVLRALPIFQSMPAQNNRKGLRCIGFHRTIVTLCKAFLNLINNVKSLYRRQKMFFLKHL